MKRNTFHIEIREAGAQWVAQCAALRLAAQGPTVAEALEALAALWRVKIVRPSPAKEPK